MGVIERESFAPQEYDYSPGKFSTSIFGGKFDCMGAISSDITPAMLKDPSKDARISYQPSGEGVVDVDFLMLEIFYIPSREKDNSLAPTRPTGNLVTSCVIEYQGSSYLLVAGKNGMLYRSELSQKNKKGPQSRSDFEVINLPTNETIWKLAVGENSDGHTVFATGGNGVFLMSDDGGVTWLLENLSANGTDLYGMDVSSSLGRPVCVGSKGEALTRLMLRKFARKKITPGVSLL